MFFIIYLFGPFNIHKLIIHLSAIKPLNGTKEEVVYSFTFSLKL